MTGLALVNLRQNLEQDAELSEKTRYRLVQQVAAGMAYLAGRGIAHQNLKLENVLVGFDDVARVS